MFNIGPLELVVLAIVGLIVLGPDRLPGLARDAARMIRTLRELASGARQQLRDELGPEFADVDLRNLDPRKAVQRAVFGEDAPDLSSFDPRRYNPGAIVRDAILGSDDDAADRSGPVSMTKSPNGSSPAAQRNGSRPPAGANGGGQAAQSNGSRPAPRPAHPEAGLGVPPERAEGTRPRPRPRPRTHFDDDAT